MRSLSVATFCRLRSKRNHASAATKGRLPIMSPAVIPPRVQRTPAFQPKDAPYTPPRSAPTPPQRNFMASKNVSTKCPRNGCLFLRYEWVLAPRVAAIVGDGGVAIAYQLGCTPAKETASCNAIPATQALQARSACMSLNRRAYAAISARINFIARDSIWRIRSADTP
jgi:hypothetical protein